MTASLISQTTVLNAPAYSDPTLYQAILKYSIGIYNADGIKVQQLSYELGLDVARVGTIESIDPSIAEGIVASQLADVEASL